jgi:hypothetical protein
VETDFPLDQLSPGAFEQLAVALAEAVMPSDLLEEIRQRAPKWYFGATLKMVLDAIDRQERDLALSRFHDDLHLVAPEDFVPSAHHCLRAVPAGRRPRLAPRRAERSHPPVAENSQADADDGVLDP